MNRHGCKICEGYKHCWHIRQDFREEYGDAILSVTYVGGYAVVTGISPVVGAFPAETSVICVGVRSIGQVNDEGAEEVNRRTLYRQPHRVESQDDHHITTAMGLREKMLNLSQ